MLVNAAFYFAAAIFTAAFKNDTFMVSIYLFVAAISAILWSSTYTTLSNGQLTKHIFFFTYRSIPTSDISQIVPHKKNGKWSYGTVVDVFSNHGEKLTLQPNRPQPFLEMLREQAPQAAYLL